LVVINPSCKFTRPREKNFVISIKVYFCLSIIPTKFKNFLQQCNKWV